MFLKWLQWTISFNILQQMTAKWPAQLPAHNIKPVPLFWTLSRILINLCAVHRSDPRRRQEIRRETCRYVNTCSCQQSLTGSISARAAVLRAARRNELQRGESPSRSALTVWLCAWWSGSSVSKLMSWQRKCGRNMVMYVRENASVKWGWVVRKLIGTN